MKIGNPFKATMVNQDATLDQIQHTFKGKQTLELKDGMLRAQSRSLVHEIKLRLGLDSAKARENTLHFRRTQALHLVEDKVAEALGAPYVVMGRHSVSGKAIAQIKQTAIETMPASDLRQEVQQEYLKPRLLELLAGAPHPPKDLEKAAARATQAVLMAAADIDVGKGTVQAQALTLPELLDLATETCQKKGSALRADELVALHQKRQMSASPELRYQALERGVKEEIKQTNTRSPSDPPFRGNPPELLAVYYGNEKDMRASGALDRLMKTLCPPSDELKKGTKQELMPKFADNLKRLVDQPAAMTRLVSTLPEEFCVSVAAGLEMIDRDGVLTEEKKQAMKTAFASNILALRLLSPELIGTSVPASAALQSLVAEKSPSLPDYMKLIDAIAARGKGCPTYTREMAAEAARSHLTQMTDQGRADFANSLPQETCDQVARLLNDAEKTAQSRGQKVSDAVRAAVYIHDVADLLEAAGAFGQDDVEVDASRRAIMPDNTTAFQAYAKLVEAVAARGQVSDA